MGDLLKIKRCREVARLRYIPAPGEPLYVVDTNCLYIGDGTTPGGNIIGQGLSNWEDTAKEDTLVSGEGFANSSVLLDTFNIDQYRSVKYFLSFENYVDNIVHFCELAVIHDGLEAHFTTYAHIGPLADTVELGIEFEVDIGLRVCNFLMKPNMTYAVKTRRIFIENTDPTILFYTGLYPAEDLYLKDALYPR